MATGPATYSGNPGNSDLDQVRFLLGDTDVSTQEAALFSDAEIQWGINVWGPLYGSDILVAAQLAENAAAQYAQSASYSADGVSVSLGPVGDSLRKLAATLKNQFAMAAQAGVQPDAGGVFWGDGKDPGTRNFMFGIRMDDDPSAGAQDFGGDWPNEYYGEGQWGAVGESSP